MAEQRNMISAYKKLYSHSLRYLPSKFFIGLGFKDADVARLSDVSVLYGTTVFLHIIVFLTALNFKDQTGQTIFFSLFLLIDAAGAALGGKRVGFFSTLLSLVESAYLFLAWPFSTSMFTLSTTLNFSLLVLGGGFISSLVDIIGKSNVIQTYQRREREYARQFLQLDHDLKKARREIKARDEFLSLASHELKTPLTTMLLKLHSMLHTVRNVSLANFSVPALMKVLENAQEQTKRLSNMINDLLNVSLITTGRLKLDKEDVDLTGVTRTVLENFSEMLKNERYKIKMNSSKKIVGKWDKNRVEQAITNLVSNAIKYGRGQPIEIKLENSGNLARFIIHDHGIGIPKEDQKILFDKFTRSMTSQEYRKGLGVGLYITYQIIQAHKGEIRVSSTQGKGTTFIVDLPLKMV